jgi:hypothetical protein
MPKWRKFHLKTLDSVDINDMPDDFTRLLWAYLPLILDSAGRGIDNATWVRSKAFPMRHDVTDEKCELALIWFAERGMIERYEVGPRQYFCIPTWEDYQGKTDREALSVIPEKPSKPLKNKVSQVKSKSRPTHDLGPSWSGLDVDVDVDVEVDTDVEEIGAIAPTPPPDPKVLLLLNQSPSGTVLQAELETYYASKGRNVPRHYQSAQQREAYEAVFTVLGSELKPLTAKGLAREMASLSKLLSWLQGCAKNVNGNGARPSYSNSAKHAPTGMTNLQRMAEAERAKSG